MSSEAQPKLKSFLIEDILARDHPTTSRPPLFCPTLYGLYCAAVAVTGVSDEKRKQRKNRRNRTVFTERQLMGLETRFDSQKYLSTPDRADLARALGLTQLQVKTWYQNRRMKWKKQVMQTGCPVPPTKPKGRPKKNSIPNFAQLF